MATALATTLHSNGSEVAARLLAGLVLGLAITAGLFWMMQYLIERADYVMEEQPMRATLEFVRVKRDETIRPHEPEITKPPPPEPEPKRPELNMGDPNTGITVPDLGRPHIPVRDDFGPEEFGGFGEGDYLPIVKIEPIYPRRALAQGVEGHCVVQYTVTGHGTVRDPIVVASQCTNPLFRQVSVDAVLKFKYKPRVIDGVAVEVPGVQNKFTFRITD